ncbi:hypothetical protein M513_12166 [Trichuris suis]|uniref:Uncharacterized protein n=1 Tax=Trichuris suis TaxID=68888 RepID=A0A085LPT0_9BILA|nr:hypothetical protein M513_12166 [Trichuris suis]
MAPKRKTSSAGTDDKPKRSRDVLCISEKVRILDLVDKEDTGRRYEQEKYPHRWTSVEAKSIGLI